MPNVKNMLYNIKLKNSKFSHFFLQKVCISHNKNVTLQIKKKYNLERSGLVFLTPNS